MSGAASSPMRVFRQLHSNIKLDAAEQVNSGTTPKRWPFIQKARSMATIVQTGNAREPWISIAARRSREPLSALPREVVSSERSDESYQHIGAVRAQ